MESKMLRPFIVKVSVLGYFLLVYFVIVKSGLSFPILPYIKSPHSHCLYIIVELQNILQYINYQSNLI